MYILKGNGKNKLIGYAIIFLIVIAILILITYYFLTQKNSKNEGFKNKNNNNIPKKIWVFWDNKNNIPSIVQKCYEIITKQCPDYDFIQLNMENYGEYVNDENILKILKDEKLGIALKSDVLRTYLMIKYGGFWMDSSIILLQSLDWIYKLNEKDEYDIFMFKANYHSSRDDKPVLESWFIASKPNVDFNKFVLEKLVDILLKPDLNLETELNILKADKDVDYQKFGIHGVYHIVYYIYIYTLFKNNISRMKFLSCYDYEYACISSFSEETNIPKFKELFTKPINNDEFDQISENKLIKLVSVYRNIANELKPVNNSYIDRLSKKLGISY